jgi:ubiquinone/menaquinone biosynthesis C-methylase UbiE
MTDAAYFTTRLPPDPRRRTLWTTLVRYYFPRWMAPTDVVLDLGCGHADFINAVTARRRIAVDTRPDLLDILAPGVEGHVGSMADLSFLEKSSVDVVLASNVFEHVSHETLSRTLTEVRRILTTSGRLVILQPNYYYCYRRYFDDYTHVTVYSHVSLCDALRAERYEILECSPRFLPLSIKSRLPITPGLIRLYLASPWKPLAGQMLVVCRPGRSH